jgi:hypothetical protein
MDPYSSLVKETLISLIRDMSESPDQFVKAPGKDFTRNRKLPFETVVRALISMGGNSVYKELLEERGYDPDTPTTSAFIQQRDKILPRAFEFLLHELTKSHTRIKKYRGYRLFAIDGSGLHIPTNPDDNATHFNANPAGNGHNLLHLNAMYDLCDRIYVDAIVQPGRHKNEAKALVDMVNRSRVTDKVIVIADRGYEGYNNLAHVEEKGWKYLIRIKDTGTRCILHGLRLTREGSYDIRTERILTRKKTKEIKARPDLYKIVDGGKTIFDFVDGKHPFYPMSFRVVRFKIADDSYQTIMTNLDQSEFSSQDIKKLYKMRWGIETSFRELKYTVGLTNFHSKKRERVVQEVFARIIMYNFAEMITSHVVISRTDTKHIYQVNFTVAIHICRHFLRLWNKAPPHDVEALIRKNILPVRPDRAYKRKIRFRTAVSFLYRVA